MSRLGAASRLSPSNAVYQLRRAELYAALGAWPEAVLLAEGALALETHFAAADLLLCEIFADAGDLRRAQAHWERMNATLAAGNIPSDDYQRQLLEVAPERVAALARVLVPAP